METVSEILAEKGEAVFSVRPGSTVLEAVDEMCRRHVGAMLVCEDGRHASRHQEYEIRMLHDYVLGKYPG